MGKRHSIGKDRTGHHSLKEELHRAVSHGSWRWPKQPIYFLTDLHADADAFAASLVASGGVIKTGPKAKSFKLTKEGKKADFIIGGDCLDKGPSTLQLLDTLNKLRHSGARVRILAGNHDVRLLNGIRSLSLEREPLTEHFFVRLGPKVVPLLKEVRSRYLKGRNALRGVPSKQNCRRQLFPSSRWFDEFVKEAVWVMPAPGIEREIMRMREKMAGFEAACNRGGLSLREAYAAAHKCREIFLDPKGEFSWFFHDMKLLHREGSFLFIHAGVNDRITSVISNRGFKRLNRMFREQLTNELFEFYYGPLANTLRTKYRNVDMPLTRFGVKHIRHRGIHAIVHGHHNRTRGQRIMLRQGMIHIEGDTSMDRNTRAKEGLQGIGAGVTIIRPEKRIIGISSDYKFAKVFEPENLTDPE